MDHKPSGTRSPEPRPYEAAHREIARKAATQGFVLLRNENAVLPLDKDQPVAVYGVGAISTIKGGTGSGDVNVREVVNIADGIRNAGVTIANDQWLKDLAQDYQQARQAWRDEIWRKADEAGGRMFMAMAQTPFIAPAGAEPVKEDAEVALYVIARNAGEGADRHNVPGDYQLTQEERTILKKICELYPQVVVIINSGSLIDLSFVAEEDNIDGVLYIGQPGMEAGNSVADVLFGDVDPSGKLTDTWTWKYEDYPNAKTFSYLSGLEKEIYHEGIFVGYRYFDTFDVPVMYSFGYGLSYTDFFVKETGVSLDKTGKMPLMRVTAEVTNTGEAAGKEVVQVYASVPGTRLEKEYRRLVGFRKTGLLQPNQTEEVEIIFSLYDLASFDEAQAAWILEAGEIILYVGTSLAEAVPVRAIKVEDEITFAKVDHICPVQETFEELHSDVDKTQAKRARDLEAIDESTLSVCAADVETEIITYDPGYEDTDPEIRAFVDTLSVDQLIELMTGDISKGQGSIIGNAGSRVPGSAAQTSACAEDLGLKDLVLADGPAGLRLNASYQMVNGEPKKQSFAKSIEGGFFYRSEEGDEEGETWYQYATASPVGTVLAMSWDPEVVKACGQVAGEEMQEFGIELWLAPGMNIHRNPLCGRNFEYYAEDPLLAGIMASAMTEGVEAYDGCGVTIKHFACNSQEDNRKHSDSILSERALREIYLKGFEIAVKEAQPKAIMTSYNLINGVHAANSYDLCTKAARNEWGFQGVIMTDWHTTQNDPLCSCSGCVRAGNDLTMPGEPTDHENLREELAAGTLDIRDLKRCAAHIVRAVWQLAGK